MSKLLYWKTLRERIYRILICMHYVKGNALAVLYIIDEGIFYMYVLRLCMKVRSFVLA